MTTPADTRSGRLAAWCDPEWLWFLGFGLLPALLCRLIGEPQKASFFFGTAIFAASLKWLGWLALGRGPEAPRPGGAFPAQLFAGLAATCAWFYVRNAVGALWPASYGLHELAILPLLLAFLHLAGAVRQALARPRPGTGRRLLGREALARAAVYAPFWGTLAVALWQVSGSLNPQTEDPLYHACVARAYVETGLFRPHPFLAETLHYPSGFGAVNAVAVSFAPLTTAQAVNLQHVFWQLSALFLLAATPALLTGRWPVALGLAPPLFVALVPLYGLFPDYHYSGTPRQMAAALLPAAGVLPLLAPLRGTGSLCAAAAVVAVLGGLAAAMNPACVPYAVLVLAMALVIFAVRARRTLGRSVAGAVSLPTVSFLVVALLIGCCDPYYNPAPREVSTAPGPASDDPGGGFSAAAGLGALSPGKVLALAENATLTRSGDEEKVLDWPEHWPYRAFPACAFLAAGLLIGWLVARPRALPREVRLLAALTAGYLGAWLVGKLAALFVIGGLHGDAYSIELLRTYLGFLLLRWELTLFFAVLCAVGLALHLLGEQAGARRRRLVPLAWMAAGLVAVLSIGAGNWPRSGVGIMTLQPNHLTTADDLALAAWCDEHLPPEKGLIGMAAGTSRAGPNRAEKHLTGLGGVPAFLLYGKQGNYCFTLTSLGASAWYDGYGDHVKRDFDADWCLRNGVHYFYVTPLGLRANPALAQGIARGRLQRLHAVGESAIYEVVREGTPG
jgi:hypothetical protein